MTTDEVIFKYGNTNVTFLTEGKNVMVNATEMARPFGESKKPAFWLRTQQAKNHLHFLTQVQMCNADDILLVANAGNGIQGTWMHRYYAMEFAKWLSPEFAHWCNLKIEELLLKGTVSIMEEQKKIADQTIKELENTVEELVPDAEFGKSVRHNSDSIPVTMFSDFLVSNGCNIGRNQLYEFFRENGYVHKKGESDRNFPTRRSTQMRILETRYPSSTTEFGPTVYVTPKGIKYFLRRKGMFEAFIERKKAVRKSKLFKRN